MRATQNRDSVLGMSGSIAPERDKWWMMSDPGSNKNTAGRRFMLTHMFARTPSIGDVAIVLAEALTVAAFGISMMAVIGYAFGTPNLYHWNSDQIPMALPTAICDAALAMAVFIMISYAKLVAQKKEHANSTKTGEGS